MAPTDLPLLRLLLLTILLLVQTTTASNSPPMGPRRRPVPPSGKPDTRVFTPDAQLKENLARAPAERKPAFVRMPVRRNTVNGTGRWKHGIHWDGTPGERERERGKRDGRGAPNISRDVVGRQRVGNGSIEMAGERPRVPERQTNTYGYKWGWEHLWDIGGIAYSIPLEIGTPPQTVMVFMDTGSYELWVNPRCNTSASPEICANHGQYYPDKSNTSKFVANGFHVKYGMGEAVGHYFRDVIGIAMFILPAVQFAVASDTEYTFTGIFGLGYASSASMSYPPILEWLIHEQLIYGKIFSIGLGSNGDEFCEIIFGGVNRHKFAGYLEPVAIWPPVKEQSPYWIQYWINATSVGMTKDGEKPFVWTRKDAFNMPVMLDTGSTLSYIREDLVAVIGQQFDAWIEGTRTYRVDCSWKEKKGTVDFGFNKGRMVINISYRDFVWEMFKGHCFLGVQPADEGSTSYVLGNTFIRAAYLVFDQQSDIIWMNQYYNCGDGVVTVGVNPMDIGNIRGAC
ncbi:aspartic peptidase domain-containing protein [Podospora conica]|nr:aspartic peptidase domain-containing protein [Schizothecium conicum]